MDVRGISTVFDVTVFLLLLGGAISTLVAGTSAVPAASENQVANEYPIVGENPAAETVEILATSTARVNYSLEPGIQRSAHGTLASLLADGAVAQARLDGDEFSTAGDEFERALASRVAAQVGHPGVRTSVVATWHPYPDSPLQGRIQIGEEPPRDADVHAATIRVDSGIPVRGERVRRRASDSGFEAVARVVARDVVRGLFPPRETQLALRGDGPTDAFAVQRYRRTADALSVSDPTLDATNVTVANDRLADALTHRLATDLSGRYESPSAAAEFVETGSVRITVRTWSP